LFSYVYPFLLCSFCCQQILCLLVKQYRSFLAVQGIELRASSLPGRCSTAWATLLVFFALIILEIGSCVLPRLAWIGILLFKAPCHSWDGRHKPPHTALFCWDGVLKVLFGTAILLVSTFCIARGNRCALDTSSFWLRWGLVNILARLALNHDFPDLSLPSSQDYRRESLIPSQRYSFLRNLNNIIPMNWKRPLPFPANPVPSQSWLSALSRNLSRHLFICLCLFMQNYFLFHKWIHT
jgi:hypothetical protein